MKAGWQRAKDAQENGTQIELERYDFTRDGTGSTTGLNMDWICEISDHEILRADSSLDFRLALCLLTGIKNMLYPYLT